MRVLIAALFLLPTSALVLADTGELKPPVHIFSEGKPIDVQRCGHAAPFVGDVDGDGLPDLLVGQFYEGKLRIYRNTGSLTEPKFSGYEWFKAGGEFGRVSTG